MLTILFGSQTGNAQNLAHQMAEELRSQGIENEVWDMGETDPETILELKRLLIVTSTYGDGEAPDNAASWLSFLKFNDELDLSHLQYGVLGLGDPYYPHFCQCGKDFDHYLSLRGARSLIARLDCDRYYEEQYGEWLVEIVCAIKQN